MFLRIQIVCYRFLDRVSKKYFGRLYQGGFAFRAKDCTDRLAGKPKLEYWLKDSRYRYSVDDVFSHYGRGLVGKVAFIERSRSKRSALVLESIPIELSTELKYRLKLKDTGEEAWLYSGDYFETETSLTGVTPNES